MAGAHGGSPWAVWRFVYKRSWHSPPPPPSDGRIPRILPTFEGRADGPVGPSLRLDCGDN